MKEKIKIQLTKSLIGVPEKLKKVVKALGLVKLNSTVIQSNTPEIQGSIFKVSHLVKVERVKK
jgi:large subunit ribosomal protein L30